MNHSTTCSRCGQSLDGLEKLSSGARSPCPNCGSTHRTIHATIEERIAARDHLAMLGRRQGKPFLFGESRRSDGRAASAERSEEGLFSYRVSGSSPQGEEQSLDACKLLVRTLNSGGATWGEPSLVEIANVDCQAVDTTDHDNVLQIQVVRALTDSQLWQTLNTRGSLETWANDSSALAQQVECAIKHKEAKIPANA